MANPTFVQDDYKVHVIGDTAIVTGRSTSKGKRKGKDWSGQERFTTSIQRCAIGGMA